MKLLFDQNLSPRLIRLLDNLFPNSNHVYPLGLGEAEDSDVWEAEIVRLSRLKRFCEIIFRQLNKSKVIKLLDY